MDLYCELPYTSVNIDDYGEVHPCCTTYCSHGNILEKNFSEIWNGDKAQNFRKQFVDKNFKYCKFDICLPHRSNDNSIKKEQIAYKRTASVLLGYDRTCNVNCIFCSPNNNQKYLKPFEIIEEKVSDLFKDVQNVNIASGGEVFASLHSRNLMKKIAETYPNIKFDILTNGLLFNEENLIELDIKNKLNLVGFSFHSFNRNSYNKIVKNSNFDKVMQNIDYAINLKKEGLINILQFRAVITSYNYKEMVYFAKKAKKAGANVVFLNLIKYVIPDKIYEELNVINPRHKNHNEFIKILQNPIFKEDFVTINPSLLKLKPKSIFNKFFKN